MDDEVQVAGQQLLEGFFGSFASGVSVSHYRSNFPRLPSGLLSPLYLHLLALADPEGHGTQAIPLLFPTFFSIPRHLVLLALQSSPWPSVFSLPGQPPWWVPLARASGFAFFASLLNQPPVPLQTLLLSSPAYRDLVIPHVFQSMGIGSEYPVCSPQRMAEWEASGLLLHKIGRKFFCQWHSDPEVDLTPLLASPLQSCGDLTDRLYKHACLALKSPDKMFVYLTDRGARRDYLVLASPALLARRVSLEEAAFLVSILFKIWIETPHLLDAIGDVLSETMQAVSLIRSLWGSDRSRVAAEALASMFLSSPDGTSRGLMSLTRACQDGEPAARAQMIARIEQTSYLGCLAQCMLAWAGVEPPTRQSGGHGVQQSSPDRHRHMTLGRSGAHYIVGETIEREEDDKCEFKAVQQTGNIVVHIARICTKYVPAFLNSGGGRLLFGVEDDGRIVGVNLARGQRDAIRLSIDTLVVEPDPSHLLELEFLPVIGGSAERYVVEVRIGAGEPGQLYCTRAGEHFVRKKGAVAMLKGPALMSYVERRIKLSKGCPEHGERLRYECACSSPAALVCAHCLLEGSHQGARHVHSKLED